MTVRACIALLVLAAAAPAQTPVSGRRVHRLIIHNATVVEGNGTPASGPKDIVVEDNRIADVIALDPVALGRAISKPPMPSSTPPASTCSLA